MTSPAPVAPKSNKKFLLVGGGAFVALVVLFCVCSGILLLGWHFMGGSSIVGKWKSTDNKGIIEFKSDGTCTTSGTEPGSLSLNGTYKISGSKLTLTFSLLGVSQSETDDFSISGNELTLTKTEGTTTETTKFTRQ